MDYYKGCKLTVTVPVSRDYDLAGIKEALNAKFPGVELTIQQTVLHAAEAYVPENHPLAGASEQKGRGPVVHTGGRSLLTMAEEVLERFK